MSKVPFCVNGAIREAWEAVKKNFFLYCGVLLVVLLLSFISGTVSSQFKENSPAIYIVLTLVIWFLSIIVKIGVLKINLLIAKGKEAGLLELFSHIELFLKFLVAGILYALMVVIGLLLLVVPGIYLALKYQFFGYLLVDKNMGPLEALKRSGEMTKGAMWDLFFLAVNIGALNLIGMVCLLVGSFVTVPIGWVATAKVYRELE